MLKSKIYKHFKADDVFSLCKGEVEGDFNEIYCPPQDGSIFFEIPEREDFSDYCEAEIEVFEVLLKYGGAECNETVCLDFSY